MIADLHERLSVVPTYKQIFDHSMFQNRMVSEELLRLCWSQFDRRKVLVVEYHDKQKEIAGIAVLQQPSRGMTDVWMAVDPRFSKQKIPDLLLEHLLEVAALEGVGAIRATQHSPEPLTVQSLLHHGFSEERRTEGTITFIHR